MSETAALLSYSSAGLMFALGLRHGLDPDHIAAIDGLTLRAMEQRPRSAPWVGTLFSLGHGLVVTLIALAVSLMSREWVVPAALERYGGWVPIGLLLLVGGLNLWSLLATADYQPVGWRSWLLPSRFRQSSHPVLIVLVGMFFALVFDTATQAAAWGYVAGARGGAWLALSLGLVFTLGMVITDTLDSRLVATMIRRAQRDEARRFRRVLGWAIVALSFGMAAYGIAVHVDASLELGDDAYFILGVGMFLCFGTGYLWTLWKTRAHITRPSTGA
ncbi:MAG: nickel transporter [Burkholderiales bacterium]